jgi:cytochrome c-type protein NapC
MPRNRILLSVVVLAALGIGSAIAWAVVDTMIHATGDHEFCSSCHSIAPMGAAYREDVHGGNNPAGWRATCSQCHISHKSSLHYLLVKGKHGLVDPLMEVIKDPYDIDWHGNRERRSEYVYDSGCLSCHQYLEQQTEGNRMAIRSHRRYFEDPDKRQCVDCHENVGHHRLGYHLEQMGWEKPQEETE